MSKWNNTHYMEEPLSHLLGRIIEAESESFMTAASIDSALSAHIDLIELRSIIIEGMAGRKKLVEEIDKKIKEEESRSALELRRGG